MKVCVESKGDIVFALILGILASFCAYNMRQICLCSKVSAELEP